MNSVISLISFQEALDDISNFYLQDVDRAIGLEAFQFAEVLSDWWQDKLDIFSLTVKIYAAFAEKAALELLDGLNDILRLKGFLPRLHCSLNNNEDDFIAIINSNGSRIYLLSQFSLHSSTWVFSTEGLTDNGLIALASQLDKQTARWAIQLLHIELKLRYLEIPARKTCMKALHRLVRNFRVLPPSLFLSNVVQEGQRPVSGGGYADIFKGSLRELGRKPVPVCLKALRVFQVYDTEQRDKLLKEFCHETFLWTQLDHQNILPCFGVSMDAIDGRLCLVSPWMVNGNIMEFLKLNPQYDRFEAILGIARGLSYLHDLEPQFVHGDIKGVNILVTEDGRCCLADFGLCLMAETHTVGVTTSYVNNKGTTRWLAPELLNPTNPKFHAPNKAARDIYAFACTVLEIYTGKPPFADQTLDVTVIFEVLQGKRPGRPIEMGMPSLDSVWEMMKECWIEDSHRRPQAEELVRRLERVYAMPQVSYSHLQSTVTPTFSLPSFSNSVIREQEHAPELHSKSLSSPLNGSTPLTAIFESESNLANPPTGTEVAAQQNLSGSQHIPQIQPQYAETTAQMSNPEKQANVLSQSRAGQSDTQRLGMIQEDIPRKRGMSAKLAQFLPQVAFKTLNDKASVGSTAQQPGLGPAQQPPWLSARDANPSTVILADLKPRTLPQDLRTKGSDWSCIFNPSLPPQALLDPKKRKNLDISLLWTLYHDSVVLCVQFSPDGKYLATGCNRTTQIFDTGHGKRICVLVDEAAGKGDLWIRSVRFSPDGCYLATGAEDKRTRIWDIAQKKLVVTFSGDTKGIYALDFTPDGKHIVSGSADGTVRMWNLQPFIAKPGGLSPRGPPKDPNGPRRCMVLTNVSGVTSISVSPDGRYLATGSFDCLVRIWDINTGQLLKELYGHKSCVYSVVFTPDGKGVISGGFDRTMKYWDVSRLYAHSINPKDGGKYLMNFVGHKDSVFSVAVSYDSQWIASGSSNGDVQFWDSRNAHVQCLLQGHKHSVYSIALNPVGNLLASGSLDGTARIWKYITS